MLERDDRAQLMLLTAVILLIGFFALAGMVARVSQLSDETLQERRRSTVVEAQAAVDGLDRALGRLETMDTIDPVAENMANYTAAADLLVNNLGVLERARGFQFVKHTPLEHGMVLCTQVGTDAIIRVGFDLIRSDTFARLTLSHTIPDAACPP